MGVGVGTCRRRRRLRRRNFAYVFSHYHHFPRVHPPQPRPPTGPEQQFVEGLAPPVYPPTPGTHPCTPPCMNTTGEGYSGGTCTKKHWRKRPSCGGSPPPPAVLSVRDPCLWIPPASRVLCLRYIVTRRACACLAPPPNEWRGELRGSVWLRPRCFPSVSSVLFRAVPYDSVRFSTVQYGSVRFSTIQYDSVRFSTIQYDSVRFSTIQ
eukprot:gene23683-biopygen14890